ncbi:MAG: hypothetical protein FWD17_16840, partial [Polyangiaceae bacterium]|nr:hypothetical protein [Polyangiaceae bacterium]
FTSPAGPVRESAPPPPSASPSAVASFAGTLPSGANESKRRKKDAPGESVVLVLILVIFALGVGFLAGWITSRM